ncbi:MAG: polyprenyl synthetase family protein [Acetatifactor sp.]|nr:polyprenyl synthetase family protein [Acetatifactor sp.]
MEIQEFEEARKQKAAQIERILEEYLPPESGWQKTVAEAMNYSLRAGGKRLRPMLMLETCRMLGGSRMVEPFMAAIEMIHTYSLIHDDLPAMDNDEYRRGCKTTWRVYGEAMGILAGDGLLNLAFETAMRSFDDCCKEEDYVRAVRALRLLAAKAGIGGMIGGQTADIEAEGQENPVTEEQLLFIHEHKTAALIQAAMMTGGILAGASDSELAKLEKCAYNVGIAFQIQDDILDVVGDSQELGKTVGSDAENHKQTYVTLKGLEESGAQAAALSGEAVRILDGFSGEHAFLKQLILTLINRRS